MIDTWTDKFIEDLNIQFDNLLNELYSSLKKVHIKFIERD